MPYPSLAGFDQRFDLFGWESNNQWSAWLPSQRFPHQPPTSLSLVQHVSRTQLSPRSASANFESARSSSYGEGHSLWSQFFFTSFGPVFCIRSFWKDLWFQNTFVEVSFVFIYDVCLRLSQHFLFLCLGWFSLGSQCLDRGNRLGPGHSWSQLSLRCGDGMRSLWP